VHPEITFRAARETFRFLCAVILFALLPAVPAFSEGDSASKTGSKIIDYGCDVDFTSSSLWHGIPQNKGFAFEPCPWIYAYGFTVSCWGDMPVTSKDENPWQFSEGEATIDYEYTWNKLKLEPSLGIYSLTQAGTSAELTLKLSYPLGKGVRVFTTHAFDVWSFPGSYFGDVGFSYDKIFSENFSVKATASLGWGSPLFNTANYQPQDTTDSIPDVNHWALNVLAADAQCTYWPFEFLYVTPHIGIAVTLDKNLQDAEKQLGFNPVTFYGGVILGVEF
jgi:hypothetical protein